MASKEKHAALLIERHYKQYKEVCLVYSVLVNFLSPPPLLPLLFSSSAEETER